MKLNGLLILASVLFGFASAGCDTDNETIDRKVTTPEEQNPALYARYLAALNAYKASEHYVIYTRMDNAPQVSTSPGDFLRALPDSLDYVALNNPLSDFDREDLPGVRAKGTKVLAVADCTDTSGAVAAVDAALTAVATEGLDGVAVVFGGPATDAARSAASAVAAKLVALGGKTVVFDGHPALVAAADRERYDYFIYDTSHSENVSALGRDVDYLTDYLGIPAGKLLLAAAPSQTLVDADLDAQPALVQAARCVLSFGPLAGLAVFGIADDYYHPTSNYVSTREAITYLNPTFNR